MPVIRNPGSTSLVDILDRVLDQGIRFDARPPRVQAGMRSAEGSFRIVIEALETHLERPELPPEEPGTGA